MSLKDKHGNNIFALTENQLERGRPDAKYDDTRFLSQEGEWFLAGVLDGLPDGKSASIISSAC